MSRSRSGCGTSSRVGVEKNCRRAGRGVSLASAQGGDGQQVSVESCRVFQRRQRHKNGGAVGLEAHAGGGWPAVGPRSRRVVRTEPAIYETGKRAGALTEQNRKRC